ncbi:MAG: GGDEF domain-containing protein, partial [Pseudomonadales bacterium]|nr:GGDEF domain-containing protein [Pseudomonadales bacterium]
MLFFKGNPKEKIQTLQSVLDKKEQVLNQLRHSLDDSLGYLSLAAEGQDDSLDRIIDELRIQMQGNDGNISPELVAQLESSANSMADLRRHRAERQLQGFSDGIAQLLLLNPPFDIRKQLAAFVRDSRQSINNPSQQELLPIKFSQLQGLVLSKLGSGDTDSSNGSISESPDLAIVEVVEGILADILVQIRPLASTESALEKARELLSAGLGWAELAELLEQLSIVVITTLDNDQHEFELFLQSLNDQLSSLCNGVNSVGDVTKSILDGGEAFDKAVRQDIATFAGDIDNASSLNALQGSVKSHLASVFGQLDQFKLERLEQQVEYEAELDVLKHQIQTLEREAARANAEVEVQQRRSERDVLTKLPNREAYERRIAIELERARRYGSRFCLVVADVDYFKQVNDTYGHLAGDKVLKVLAKTMQQRLRLADFIARYGGEEFVILLPETDAKAALALMDTIGMQIRDCPFHFKSKPLKVTIS